MKPKIKKCAIPAKNVYSMFIDLDPYVTINAPSHVVFMCYQVRRNKNIAISLEICVFGANALIIGFMLCHLLIYH